MSKYSRRNFLKLAGASVAVGVSGAAIAGENPFEFKALEGGYQQVAAAQGNCGANQQMSQGSSEKQMKQSGQNSNASQMKNAQGACGAEMMKKHNGNCGAATPQPKQPEGKCGGGNSMK